MNFHKTIEEKTLFLVSRMEYTFFKEKYPHVIIVGKNNKNKFLLNIVEYLHYHQLTHLFVNCHFKCYQKLINFLDIKKMDIKIFATHQKKRYIHRHDIARFEKVLEYAPIASQKSFSSSFNFEHPEKYLHFNFPTYVPEDIIQFLRKKKTKKYYFAGGSHGRDYNTLIRAFALIPDKLIICAKKDNKGRNIKHLPLTANITWIENIPRIQFLKYMAHAKAVILPIPPSNNVLGHTSLSEAIVLGKPIISVNERSLVENLQDKKNAIIIRNTPEAYLKAVTYLNRENNYHRLKKNMQLIQDTRLVSSHFKFINSLLQESMEKIKKNSEELPDESVVDIDLP